MKFLVLLVLLCGSAAAQSAKDLMLQSVVKNAVAPGYARLANHCRLLSEAAKKLDAAPNPSHLEQARASWLDAAVAAQELDCFKIGPIADASDAAAFYFLPVRPASIERAIQALPENGDADLQQLGATAKGLFALEYLLFPETADPAAALARFSGETGAHRRRYLFLVAQEAACRAERLERDWKPPFSASAVRFLNGGQDSLNALVNQLAMTTESVTMLRLEPLVNPPDRLSRDKIPGAASGHSHVLLQAAVHGLHRIHGGGLNQYTRHLNPSLADHLDRQFGSTLDRLAALDRPLESSAPDHALRIAEGYQNCNALNVLLKVDLPSTLGVTLTFISTDGD